MAGITTDYFSTGTGAPSGAPSVPTGEVAVYVDKSTGNFWVYNALAATPAWVAVTGGGSGVLTNATNQLASAVTLTNANTFYDTVSLSLAAGTWLLNASIMVESTTTAGQYTAELWDGTTVAASAYVDVVSGIIGIQIPLTAIVSPTGTTTYKVSVACTAAGNSVEPVAYTNGVGSNVSTLVAVKIG